MKKFFLIFIALFILLFLFSDTVKAIPCSPYPPDFTGPPEPGVIDHVDTRGSLVPCGQYPDCRCEISDFFDMILRIYNFIVWNIATPLAGLLIVIGGILIVISGGPGGSNPITGVISPNLYTTAKSMITGAVIGIFLVFGSWLIIDIVLKAIGYTGTWSSFQF